jgi:hemin uptake protein HemP
MNQDLHIHIKTLVFKKHSHYYEGMLTPSPIRQSHPTRGEAPCAPRPGTVRALDLLGDRQVLLIEHAGERYQLRLTRNGKLILTK